MIKCTIGWIPLIFMVPLYFHLTCLNSQPFRFYWDMIIVAILFIQIFVLPVSIAFYSGDFSVAWLSINGISDTIFILDMILNFHTGIPDHENEHLVCTNIDVCIGVASWIEPIPLLIC